MATDEADAALNHQRNGFTGVLKTDKEELLPTEEDETGHQHGNKLRTPQEDFRLYMCTRLYVYAERVGAHPAVARRQHFFPFSFVYLESPGIPGV